MFNKTSEIEVVRRWKTKVWINTQSLQLRYDNVYYCL